MRPVPCLLYLVYARELSHSVGGTSTSDICMLQLQKRPAAKIGSANSAAEKETAANRREQRTDSETNIGGLERYAIFGNSKASPLRSDGHEGHVALAGLTQSKDDSHVELSSIASTSATDSFQSEKCQRFYLDPAPPGYPWGVGAHDQTTNMFRPAVEISTMVQDGGTVKTWPEAEFKRMVTYEDVVTPADFHGSSNPQAQPQGHCMHYAVRTPQRPVKTMAGTGHNGQTFAMPAVWKSGSTSFNAMLNESSTDFHWEHSKNDKSRSCQGPFELQQCEKHSSFDSSAAEIMFAVVRNPLDRFISGIKEHSPFGDCQATGQACPEDVQLGKSIAASLSAGFPYNYNSCRHATQSYLLSGTDLYGNPMSFQKIIRLEEKEEGLHELESTFDQSFKMPEKNTKGTIVKTLLYDAVFSDLATLCAICKVYAQDFECFGYAIPEKCTEDQCASVGVILKPDPPFH